MGLLKKVVRDVSKPTMAAWEVREMNFLLFMLPGS
jgi:hypothetical protein